MQLNYGLIDVRHIVNIVYRKNIAHFVLAFYYIHFNFKLTALLFYSLVPQRGPVVGYQRRVSAWSAALAFLCKSSHSHPIPYFKLLYRNEECLGPGSQRSADKCEGNLDSSSIESSTGSTGDG